MSCVPSKCLKSFAETWYSCKNRWHIFTQHKGFCLRSQISGFVGRNRYCPNLLPGQMQEVKGSEFDGLLRTIIIIEVITADLQPYLKKLGWWEQVLVKLSTCSVATIIKAVVWKMIREKLQRLRTFLKLCGLISIFLVKMMHNLCIKSGARRFYSVA